MKGKKKVIFVTDGDETAAHAVKAASETLGCYFLTLSQGNPSPVDAKGLIKKIKEATLEPVVLLFDDAGCPGIGQGEQKMTEVAKSPEIFLIGVVAVAAHSYVNDWTKVHLCVDRQGKLTEYGVDKEGFEEVETGRIRGDTVDCLDINEIPIIIGIGDVGKMGGYDALEKGAPVTKKALTVILERSGLREPPK
ncbi:stage V sporulation protein AE [Salipaludibacillus keqinensis]|nr:stage V sporulation protein AE [Salipaludibacillus keqinensis]